MHGRITSDSGKPYYGMPYDRLWELAEGRGRANRTLLELVEKLRAANAKWVSFFDHEGKSKMREEAIEDHRRYSINLIK